MAVPVLTALAQSLPSVPGWERFGDFGVVGALAALGIWFIYQAYKRERDRADRLEGMLFALQSKTIDEFAPLINHSAEVLKDVVETYRHRS